jgi:hypothetical protein
MRTLAVSSFWYFVALCRGVLPCEGSFKKVWVLLALLIQLVAQQKLMNAN